MTEESCMASDYGDRRAVVGMRPVTACGIPDKGFLANSLIAAPLRAPRCILVVDGIATSCEQVRLNVAWHFGRRAALLAAVPE